MPPCTMSSREGVHEYPVVDGIRTHVIKHGDIDEYNRLVLVIPGNPGPIEFYDEFMSLVHQDLGWPVWGVSHAGHSTIPHNVSWQGKLQKSINQTT